MKDNAIIKLIDQKLEILNKENMQGIAKAINDALGKDPTRYVDVSRVPLLCKSVIDIRETINEIKNMIKENRKSDDEEHKKFVTKDGQYFVIRVIVFTGAGSILLWSLKMVFDSISK